MFDASTHQTASYLAINITITNSLSTNFINQEKETQKLLPITAILKHKKKRQLVATTVFE
jgi:hypothetical protein